MFVATDTVLPGSRTDNSRTVIIATLVPIVVLLLILFVGITSVIVIVLLLVNRQKGESETGDHDLAEEKKSSERSIIAQEVNINSTSGKVEAALPLQPTIEAELPPDNTYETCGPREKIKEEDEKILPKELLVVNNRNSLIESDVHLPAEGNLNSPPALVIICETGQETATASAAV